ncbi:RCC1 and BTB domain-containing protein 2 [Dermatophagoides farinae]|uniref:RCC1 and BTB domain-containing protein 2 n=1 Tax=Dermatophagoides farinae TaxID=6954 RepID=UPI003F5E38FA
MARSLIESIDFKLFQDDFKNIDQKFLQSVVSIFSFFTFKWYFEKQFLLITENATYAYGDEICSWFSLEHDMTKPQRISLFNDVIIVQVDSGHGFVAILTDDGRVYLASNDSNWKTNNTFRLINTGNDRFKMIACGWHHLLMLRHDGHVFAIGHNSFGQITGNEKSSYESMIQIDNLKNVKLIACGGYHSFSITKNGEIFSWGLNDFGQLGLGDEENRITPCLVAFPNANSTRIKDIVAGEDYSLFLFKNGEVWGCGSNYAGELGLGDENNRSILTKIPIENVQQIACSSFHSFSLAHDGSSYYAWGETKNGTNWSSPRKLDDSHSSFASASVQVLDSPLTFGLTSTIYEFGSHDSISYKSILPLFDNQDNYDVKFIIDENYIKACKFYLKSVSEYYRRMFSGNWIENDQVTIDDYSYETYYAYLRMLHTGKIHINRQNITELVDLANCYGDERLMEYCETFIRNDLDEQTMPKYLPLINKYELKGSYTIPYYMPY